MTVDMGAFELALLELGAELDSPDRVEAWLADPQRTAHRLVSVPTGELVAQALGTASAEERTADVLPRGLWRILPDRLLALHPGRGRAVTVAEHLHLTAAVLEEWGWAQPGRHRRTTGGRRCIKGAQYAVYRLGYGTEADAVEAGRQIQGALHRRGITLPYPAWNDQSTTTQAQVLAVVLEAAAGVT